MVSGQSGAIGQPINFSWTDLIFFLIFAAILILIQSHKKFSGLIFKIFLILVVFSGAQIFFEIFLSSLMAISLALIAAILFVFLKNIFVHDLAIIIGLAGVGAILGLSITPQIGLIALVALSFYDIIAVYKTKHMVTMAKNMIESGAVFGFIIPFDFRGFFSGKGEVKDRIGEKFMILGSGDIGLPLIFASSLVPVSIVSAAIVGIFSILGLFVTHLIFINQKQRAPMAALPPIATFAIIGYLVSILL